MPDSQLQISAGSGRTINASSSAEVRSQPVVFARPAAPAVRHVAPPHGIRPYKMGYSNSSYLSSVFDVQMSSTRLTSLDQATQARLSATALSFNSTRVGRPPLLPARPVIRLSESTATGFPVPVPPHHQPAGPEVQKAEVCVVCGREATCKCSNCSNEFYCGRECQLKVGLCRRAICLDRPCSPGPGIGRAASRQLFPDVHDTNATGWRALHFAMASLKLAATAGAEVRPAAGHCSAANLALPQRDT